MVSKRLDEDSFEYVAQELSTCPSAERDGLLGRYKPGTLSTELDKVVIFFTDTEIGRVVGPIHTKVRRKHFRSIQKS